MNNMINEGNISNSERQYRNFLGLVTTYCPNINLEKITVEKTPKGNWKVYDENGRKICLVSKMMLTDELIDSKNIRKCCDNC